MAQAELFWEVVEGDIEVDRRDFDLRRTARLPGKLAEECWPADNSAVVEEDDVDFGVPLERVNDCVGVSDFTKNTPASDVQEGLNVFLNTSDVPVEDKE